MYILMIISNIIINRALLKQRRRHYSNNILYSCYRNALREVGPRLTFHLLRSLESKFSKLNLGILVLYTL